MSKTGILRVGVISFLIAGSVLADDSRWPRFRGANGVGVAANQQVPVTLDARSQAWSVSLPGPGSSSPVVWGERLFVTAEDREKGQVTLLCLNAKSGVTEWERTVNPGQYHTHKMNNTAAATPCLAEDLVVFGWYDAATKKSMLSAFSHAGKPLWDYEVGDFEGWHGTNLHPEIHGEKLLLVHLHHKGGYVGAINIKDGTRIWKTPFEGGKVSYVTPYVRSYETPSGSKKEVIFASKAISVRAVDLDTGKETWSLPKALHERAIVSPIDVLRGGGAKDSLIGVGCKDKVYHVIRPPHLVDGKMTEAKIEWTLDKKAAPYVSTPVSDGKTLYVLADWGTLSAVNPRTGEIKWSHKFQANFYASPLLIGGKIYCKSRDGEVFVVKAGEKFELLGTSHLKPGDEITWADSTPAVAHNSLYVRVGARLDCYRKK